MDGHGPVSAVLEWESQKYAKGAKISFLVSSFAAFATFCEKFAGGHGGEWRG
jgi:hypothetical protein